MRIGGDGGGGSDEDEEGYRSAESTKRQAGEREGHQVEGHLKSNGVSFLLRDVISVLGGILGTHPNGNDG